MLRRPGLFESVQRDHRIVVAGPTTLAALPSSLRMGFRTLAIEKRSAGVRSRAISRRLRDVEAMDVEITKRLLGDAASMGGDSDDEGDDEP